MKGIYVIHLPEMEKNVYKIGCSKNIERRIHDFNTDTLRLNPIEVIYKKEFLDYKKAEKLIHKKLCKYRIAPNKEFFNCPIDKIIEVINSINLKEETEPINTKREKEITNLILQYYRHYKSLHDLELIFEYKSLLARSEMYWYLKDFLNSYYIVLFKVETLPESTEKEYYIDLLQNMKKLIITNQFNKYLTLIENNDK